LTCHYNAEYETANQSDGAVPPTTRGMEYPRLASFHNASPLHRDFSCLSLAVDALSKHVDLNVVECLALSECLSRVLAPVYAPEQK
jgi:hypothetical protein